MSDNQRMNISDEAVEAAAKRYYEASTGKRWENLDHSSRARERSWMRRALEAAAPYLMADMERELEDAKRMVALLLLKAGGRVTITQRDMVGFNPATLLERVENPATGEWVISASSAGVRE